MPTGPRRDVAPGDPGRTSTASWVDHLTSRLPVWLVVATAWVIAIGVIAGAGLWLLDLFARLLVVTLPMAIAIILTTLCWPPRERLIARGMPPSAAAAIVVIGGLLVFVGVFVAIGPGFVEQIQALGPTLLSGWDSVVAWLETGPLGVGEGQLTDLLQRAQDAVTSGSSGLVGGIASGVATVGQFLGGLALMLVLLFFIVKDGDVLVRWAGGLLAERHRPTASALGRRAWTALSGYVRGTALIALIDALGIGLGLLILGVPLVLPLMLLVFFGGFLPVVGAFVAGLVAVLVALADGGFVTAAITLAIVLAVQQIEGNFLHPTIMRRAVNLHPIVVLSALAAGAALAGIVGAFLAVPTAAVLASVGNEVRLRAERGLLTRDTIATAPDEPLGGPGGSLEAHEVSLVESADHAGSPGSGDDTRH